MLRARLPEWDEVPLRLAESHRRQSEIDEAARLYQDALELNPRRPEALLGLGALLLPKGDVAQAQRLFLSCCGIAPDRAEAWSALGATLLLTGDHRAAETALAEAQRLAPDDVATAVRRADAAMRCGTAQQELARLEVALEHDPANAALLTARAFLRDGAGDRDASIEDLMVATVLRPEEAESQRLLAQVLVRANRVSDALAALDRAIVLEPKDLGLLNNRAATLLRLNRHREACDDLTDLIAEHGEQPGLMNNLVNALISLGRQDEGAAWAVRAVRRDPVASLAWRSLCNALPYCDGVGGNELLAVNLAAGAILPRSRASLQLKCRDEDRPIRVGLLSSSLKTHPVGWLTVAGFENLDPRKFELHAIGPEHGRDAIYRRFRVISGSWTKLDGVGEEGAVRRIRDLDLDVIIDLGGYGDLGLLPLCAHRLAPVQVKWVGSQNHSTGLAEMDWFISDRWETPDGVDHFYSERLLRLPDGYVCYSPPPYAPDVGPLPALAAGRVTFGCFNNLAKITRATIDAWAAILIAATDARLVIKCHQMGDSGTRERILVEFNNRGIATDQLEFRAASPHRDLLAQYGDIDIVLDPFPYCGGLTTCEALWMGVPVLTLPGEIFASRHSASHLSNIGLNDWIAGNVSDYVARALRFASDITLLVSLRASLRGRMKASPLCDGVRFGRNLGVALRGAWRDWCRAGA
jgi:predicted O-linked N-acetylglucosamine transferase (SPINDLY family)